MALSTEVPAGGFCRLDDPRGDPVPGRHGVARRALELDMVGYRERPRDLAVARRTFSWDRRRLRVVRIVAGKARVHRGVGPRGGSWGPPPGGGGGGGGPRT